ncbi:MAG: GNAT family N-acetyltransferase [Lachnospiraceae bacterium]|nr:GNAT family N-acetyltransferase [Lachnospiraceae bacterium]
MQLKNNLYASRITVRDYRKSDLPFLVAMWFDEENGKYLSDPTKDYVNDEYRKALEKLEDNPHGYYLTLVLNASEEIMGSCFMFPDDKKESFDIAYCIHKNYWRQGYATELIPLIIDWVHGHGGIEITAEVAKENIASNSLLRKNGFEVIRETRFKKYNMDVYFDSYIYRLILKKSSVG